MVFVDFQISKPENPKLGTGGLSKDVNDEDSLLGLLVYLLSFVHVQVPLIL